MCTASGGRRSGSRRVRSGHDEVVDDPVRLADAGSNDGSRGSYVGHALILSYFFPPAAGGGVVRPVKLAKYLSRLGWRVTVLTVRTEGTVDPLLATSPAATIRVREWPFGPLLRLVDLAVKNLRSVFDRSAKGRTRAGQALSDGFVHDEVEIAASHLGWAIPAVSAASRLHRRRPVDVVVASTPPASAGTTAWMLRRLLGLPYLVEYRDPWTVSPVWTEDESGKRRRDLVTSARLAITRGLETIMLRSSSGAIVVNAQTEVAQLRSTFSSSLRDKPIVQIRNGVDRDDIDATRTPGHPIEPSIPFRVLHAGFFYYYRSPHQVIEALRLLRQHDETLIADLEVEFLGGGFPDRLAAAVTAWGLDDVVKITGPVTYSDTLRQLHRADALLVVLPRLASHTSCIPTKLYEYLAIGKPIVAVVDPRGGVADLLQAVPHAYVVDNESVESVTQGLGTTLPAVRRLQGATGDGRPGDEHEYALRAHQLDRLLGQVASRAAFDVVGRARACS